MNIFFVHRDPIIAASMLCDQHVTKMITESIQILSTAHHVAGQGNVPAAAYKISNRNHPCNLWVRESTENYRWLWRHARALGYVAATRYGAANAQALRRLSGLADAPVGVPKAGLTPLKPAMREPEIDVPPEYYAAWVKDATHPRQPDMFDLDQRLDLVVAAYRQFYIQSKSRFARWTGHVPAWYLEGLIRCELLHRLRQRKLGSPWPKGMTKTDSTLIVRRHPSLPDFRLQRDI